MADKEYNETVTWQGDSKFYLIWFSSVKYKKLLAIQTEPESHVWFKDKEISYEELINILDNIEIKKQ